MRSLSSTTLRFLGTLYSEGTLDGYSDRDLLERLSGPPLPGDCTVRDLAFATLVKRHGQVVWRVCRSLALGDQDAEDTFQTTFMVLFEKRGSLRVERSVGPWLYEVAYRLAMNARATALRRRVIEQAARSTSVLNYKSSDVNHNEHSIDRDDAVVWLHQEIRRLPVRLQVVILLCDMEKTTYQEAAIRLGIPIGTVQSRLARARSASPATREDPSERSSEARRCGSLVYVDHRLNDRAACAALARGVYVPFSRSLP